MKAAHLIALLMTVLAVGSMAWADGPGGPTTKPHTLPADPKTAVITVTVAKDQAPLFQVFGDGSAVANSRLVTGQPVKGKLTPEELHALVKYALDDMGFADIKSADLLQYKGKKRGLDMTTTISITADGTTYQCSGLPGMRITEPGSKPSPAERFVNVSSRFDLARRIVFLGGEKELAKVLAAVDAKVNAKYPDEPPMQAGELNETISMPNGGMMCAFVRNSRLPDGSTNVILANVMIDSKGNIQVTLGGGIVGNHPPAPAGH